MMNREEQQKVVDRFGLPDNWNIVGYVRGDDDRHYIATWHCRSDMTYRLYVRSSNSAGTEDRIVAAFEANEEQADTAAKIGALPLNRWQMLQLFTVTGHTSRFDADDIRQIIRELQRDYTPLQWQPSRIVMSKYDEAFAALTEAKTLKKRESYYNKSCRLKPFEDEVSVYKEDLLRRLEAVD